MPNNTAYLMPKHQNAIQAIQATTNISSNTPKIYCLKNALNIFNDVVHNGSVIVTENPFDKPDQNRTVKQDH